MEQLSLEIFDLTGKGSQYATLQEDASITITDTSEIFASGDVWSYSFTLNVRANAHIFGTSGEIHGSRLHDQINKRRARLWAAGVPLFTGYLKIEDETEVDKDGNVEVAFEGGQKTFEEMTEGAQANQVPLMTDVMFGVALWRKRWTVVGFKASAYGVGKEQTGRYWTEYNLLEKDGSNVIVVQQYGDYDQNSIQQYPRMVFPKGTFKDALDGDREVTVNCINTDTPYDDGHPYCNIALCYQKTGYDRKDQYGNITQDYSSDPEAQRAYEYMPANRVNSAPNFYVIYWIRSLMKHLGIHIDENQMMDVEDLRRLFFVNTKCAYAEPKNRLVSKYGRYKFSSKGRLIAEQFIPKVTDTSTGGAAYTGPRDMIKVDECGFECSNTQIGEPTYYLDGQEISLEELQRQIPGWIIGMIPNLDHVNVQASEFIAMNSNDKAIYEEQNGVLHGAYATSDCFPDADISEVIQAIENGFGVRFLFSGDYKRVRIVLLRSIFRDATVQEIDCDVISVNKTDNCIRGFRTTYGNTEDTQFYYKGFADKLPHKKPYFIDNSDTHDYSHWDLHAEYAKIINKVSAFDKTCFVTPNTGNAYGIKVDKNAKRYDELHPSMFEYAGFMDAEDGDCSGDEETIKTITMGFTPAIMNDLNMEQERKATTDAERKQRFALFVDETMRPRRPDLEDLPNDSQPGVSSYDDPDAVYDVEKLYDMHGNDMSSGGVVRPGEFAITSDMYAEISGLTTELSYRYDWWQNNGVTDGYWRELLAKWSVSTDIAGHFNEGYRLYLQDNYEPNDDGVSPIETHAWGLTLGIMRGSGSDAHVEYAADDKDNDGNATWEIVPGTSATAHPDTCDSYGNMWDYDIECTRSIEAMYLTAAGWTVSGEPEDIVPFSYNFTLHTQSDGDIDFLCTPIKYQKSGARPDPNPVLTQAQLEAYVTNLWETFGSELIYHDSYKLIMSAKDDSGHTTMADGRFSLKLRAEKPNPYFDMTQPESTTNKRYLEIENASLRQRGIHDTFYKEYSFWIRNARIATVQVSMTLAQLLTIDKTKKVTVGDVTGFIRKMQYTISNKSGLGLVTMEIMYI